VTMKFVPNPAGIKAVGATPAMVAAMKQKADAVAAQAQDLARAEAFETGAYANGIEGIAGVEDATAIGRTSAKDFKSGWIEFGTLHQAAKHILARAAEMLGLHIEVGGRGSTPSPR
jgi:hypothetical protein